MKKDIIAHMRENSDMGVEQAEKALSTVIAAISAVANRDGLARIPGFGTFKVKDRAASVARNPRTGETVQVAARRVLTFKEVKRG